MISTLIPNVCSGSAALLCSGPKFELLLLALPVLAHKQSNPPPSLPPSL